MMIETAERKIIRLEPGISLDDIAEGDIIKTGTHKKLIVRKTKEDINIAHRANPDAKSKSQIILREYKTKDYNIETGQFEKSGVGETYKEGDKPWEELNRRFLEAGV